MRNAQDNAAPGIYHGNLISSLQSMRDRMMAVLVPKFGEAFDGDFDAMLEAINALKRIDTSPNGSESQQAGAQAIAIVHMDGYRWNGQHWQKDSPKGGSDARDAARWRYVRRKLCLTGNGDGTCGMQAINLPGSIPGWPDTSDDVVGFCEAAIDAAMQAQAGDAGVQP